ncbi:hypothetical protein [Hyphomicrobium sp.]|uniref:hypothetical protein n=1 Tax=Hyphomicrobium sp. TaxID=82 RepID=UPI003F70D672
MTEKSIPQPSSPQVRSRTLTPYVVGWSVAATLAVVYLGLLMTKPTDVAGYLTADSELSNSSADPDDPVELAANHAVAEVRTLRNTIDLFRNELIELRAQVSSQTEAARDLTTRIAAIETAPQQTAALTPKEKAALAKAEKAKAAEPAQVAAAAAAEQKKAKDEKKAAAAKAAKPDLETGSVAQPAAGAITFGPPTVTTTIAVPGGSEAADAPAQAPSNKLVGVRIATGPSVDSLRLSWTLLNERHGQAISSLQPRVITDVSGSEQTFDLLAGPVANVDEARKLCQELALKATPCQVARYTGDAL